MIRGNLKEFNKQFHRRQFQRESPVLQHYLKEWSSRTAIIKPSEKKEVKDISRGENALIGQKNNSIRRCTDGTK